MKLAHRVLAVATFIALCFGATGGGISRPQTLVRTTTTSYPGIAAGKKYAVVTDLHFKWTIFGTNPRNDVPANDMMDTLLLINPEALIIGGDWSEQLFYANANGNEDAFQQWLDRATFPVLPVIGNWEALPSDTLLHNDPYVSARARFPSYFANKKDWYVVEMDNICFIALQNNANIDTTSTDDYRQNNPYTMSSNGYALNDFGGITYPDSPQRIFLRTALSERNRNHWLWLGGHRQTYGTNVSSNRLNLLQGRGTGYIKEVEDSLGTNERAIALFGDQHVGDWITFVISDSAVSSTKGIYHTMVSSGAGLRSADTTDVLGGAGLMSYLYPDVDGMHGKTSEGKADTMTAAAYPGNLNSIFTWALLTVNGDYITIEVFITWTTNGAGHPLYTGEGTHMLIDRRTFERG